LPLIIGVFAQNANIKIKIITNNKVLFVY